MNSSLNDTGVGIVSVRLYPGFVRTSFEMNENGSTLSLYLLFKVLQELNAVVFYMWFWVVAFLLIGVPLLIKGIKDDNKDVAAWGRIFILLAWILICFLAFFWFVTTYLY